MMNPRISTSLPLYDLIVCVTSESARIESTSWANVSVGISSGPASRREGTNATRKSRARFAGNPLSAHISLGQRCKVLRDLRAIREHRRQQSGKGAQQDDARQDCGLERVEEEWIR